MCSIMLKILILYSFLAQRNCNYFFLKSKCHSNLMNLKCNELSLPRYLHVSAKLQRYNPGECKNDMYCIWSFGTIIILLLVIYVYHYSHIWSITVHVWNVVSIIQLNAIERKMLLTATKYQTIEYSLLASSYNERVTDFYISNYGN